MPHLSDIPVKHTIPGFAGRIIHGDKSTLAFWDILKGSASPEHHHIHEQMTYVASGEIEMVIGGAKHHLKEGDVVVIPSNTPHSAFAITDVRLIDSFAPARDDYR